MGEFMKDKNYDCKPVGEKPSVNMKSNTPGVKEAKSYGYSESEAKEGYTTKVKHTMPEPETNKDRFYGEW